MEKKIKVLFISSWYPNRISPTNGDFIQRHAEAVGKYCEVIFLHVMYDPEKNRNTHEWLETKNEYYHEILVYFGIRFPKLKVNKFLKYLYFYFIGFKYILKSFGKPEIIHSNIIYPVSLFALFIKKIYKVPFIVSEHWTIYRKSKSDLPGSIKFITKKVLRNADCIVPVTQNLLNSLNELTHEGNYKIVPNTVDISLFYPDLKAEFDKIPIIHISSLKDEHKNLSGILRVMKDIYSTRHGFLLNIIGPENNELIKYADELGINNRCVFFQGQKKYNEIGGLLRNSAFLLLFSNYENLPCVIVEAFACGIPVISTDVGGINEHVNEKTGILINPNNEEELKNAVNYMLDNYLKYNKNDISKYANEKFSYESIGKQFFQIYTGILNKEYD